MIHARYHYTLKSDQDDQTIAKHIVIQSAKELRGEKRREAALRQE
jgi:hypothetical protein